MNKWINFEFNNVKDEPNCGVAYVVEFGKYIKIGCTKNIKKRYSQLKNNAKNYFGVELGRCFYTVTHDLYKETEKQFHQLLEDKRISKTELFTMSLNEFLDFAKDIEYDISIVDYSEQEDFIKRTMDYIKGNNVNKNLFFENVDDAFRKTYCTYCTDEEFENVLDLIEKANTKNINPLYAQYLAIKIQNIIFGSLEKYLILNLQ